MTARKTILSLLACLLFWPVTVQAGGEWEAAILGLLEGIQEQRAQERNPTGWQYDLPASNPASPLHEQWRHNRAMERALDDIKRELFLQRLKPAPLRDTIAR